MPEKPQTASQKTSDGPRLRHRHLLGIDQLTKDDVLEVLETAKAFLEVSRRRIRKVPTLRGRTILNVFYEASTRTRTSFELAGKRLSADVVNINVATSSVSKGETLWDTCATLGAMHPDILVIRHPASGAADYVSQRVGCSVVNAGDGSHEHPTQALLDAFTILMRRGSLDGLTIAICGDIAHSRVARSNIALLRLFGADIRVAGPMTLIPVGLQSLGVKVYPRIEDAIAGVDVIMALRIQRERLEAGMLSSLREYGAFYGIGASHLALAKKDAMLMHPGPINRGVEIAPELAYHSQSVVLDQVEAGIAVRMAVLFMMLGDSGAA